MGDAMKRSVVGLFVASALALGGSVGLAGSAVAATSDCPVGYACQWRDTGYRSGTAEAAYFSFYECQYDFSVRTYGGVLSGNMSVTSISNRGRYDRVYYYVSESYHAPIAFSLAIGTGDGNLGDSSGHAPAGFNDRLDSGRFAGTSLDCM